MKPREYTLESGTKIFLGKNAENNDELVSSFKGKENVILHTVAPGSPFCVICKLDPTKKEIQEAAMICASKSQDWRDKRLDVLIHQFTGHDIKKPFFAKTGTWRLRNKPKVIKVRKKDIENVIKRNSTR